MGSVRRKGTRFAHFDVADSSDSARKQGPPRNIRNGTMNRICNFLTAASVGAGLAYFFDPVVGNRRRALARDQLNHFCNKAGDAADVTWRDLQNRANGVMAELTGLFRADLADDDILVDRVRSKMGR